MGKKFKKFKQVDQSTGQYSQGGSHKEVPIWPARYKQEPEIVEETAEPVHRIVYTWTFKINWAEVILWALVIFTIWMMN